MLKPPISCPRHSIQCVWSVEKMFHHPPSTFLQTPQYTLIAIATRMWYIQVESNLRFQHLGERPSIVTPFESSIRKFLTTTARPIPRILDVGGPNKGTSCGESSDSLDEDAQKGNAVFDYFVTEMRKSEGQLTRGQAVQWVSRHRRLSSEVDINVSNIR